MERIISEEQKRSEQDGETRRSFFRRAAGVAAGAGVVGATALMPNKALATEDNPYLTAQAFQDIRRHENAHVAALVKALGGNARPQPTFQNLQQANVFVFAQTSKTLENTGAGAYTAAASNIFNPLYLASAASIALIEGRHASFLNALFDVHITTNVLGQEQSFEGGLSPTQVGNLAGPFIANLNGGPPLTYDGNPNNASPSNDIAILNFALALEYLESNFYNINVPLFFGSIGA